VAAPKIWAVDVKKWSIKKMTIKKPTHSGTAWSIGQNDGQEFANPKRFPVFYLGKLY
jgi:hypothetical protein